ncbi:hypothetical protein ACGFY9_47580 [Streptomyces sp. NPDC048504]|uniref:hypothetical protein n=1 Tax=Streptomyces sp. NPDC048504 TaxID=3365559 RepID=UPI0037223DBA
MPQTSSELPDFFARHRALLEQAVAATASRDPGTQGRFATLQSRRSAPVEETPDA